ncbi:efflux RND transporter periplasmic adaptor subunit [Rhizobium sp. 007]|nr:efflux RND transporter periplasmic adaptor subunit [Rhizobium sp. 007]
MAEPELSKKPRHPASRTGSGLLVLLLAVTGAGTLWFRHDDQTIAAIPPPDPAVPVHVETVMRTDVPIYLSGLGTVQAFNTVTVKTQVDGTLQDVRFREGQAVRKGDVLAVVDPRPFQDTYNEALAKLNQDQVNLANAKVTLDRDVKIVGQSITQQTLDNQRATYNQLAAQVEQDQAAKSDAATQLSYTQITSPLDGRTGIRLVDQGNIVHATDTTGLVVITQTQPISVISTLPEDDLPGLQAALNGGTVAVTALTKDGTKLGDGTLTLIDNEIDQTTGTVRLKSSFPNKSETLWPGQFVELRVRQQLQHDATTVSSSAVQRGPAGFFVYVVKADNTVEARPVTIGQVANGRASVATGLTPGERVVTSGQYRLEPGIKVVAQDDIKQLTAASQKG